MSDEKAGVAAKSNKLKEVRYSLRTLYAEVQEEREASTIGQEIVDQSEIEKLFNSKKRARRGRPRQ